MDIPLSILLLLCLIFVLIGAVFMLLLQYYVYIKIANVPEETTEQKEVHVKYTLPLAIQETARAIKTGTLPSVAALKSYANTTTTNQVGKDEGDKSPLVALNFIMQFIFHELKNRNRVRKWFYRKLSLELDELLAKTTTGKLFDKLTIKELELGEQFPEIKALHVSNVDLDDAEGRIDSLDLILDLHYMGNFRTTIDADMVLGKKGSLTLKVKQLSGLARLQFTRLPYTHWSLSFVGDPKLDLAVESKYQGRQMQSNITSLISNQIRKAVRRKHTLPNYKLRYKPFFHRAPEEDSGDAEGIQPNGTLEVKISEISRLMTMSNVSDIYCTLTMASLAFVETRQKDDRNVIVSLNVEIRKAKNQQIGIVFKQTAEHLVEIDAVLPNTPACKSDLRSGDLLIAIEGKPVVSIQQVAKLVKNVQNSVFCLRIERVIPGIIRNDAILEDLELYEDMGDLRTNYNYPQKMMEPESAIKQIVARTIDKNTSSESSLSNTPTSSPKKSKFIPKALKKSMSRDNCEHSKDDEGKNRMKLLSRIEEKTRSPSRLMANAGMSFEKGIHDVEHFHQHSTIDCILTSHICMEDLSMFKLNSSSKFLNVCVYGKSPGESTLIGYVNIPIVQLLAESLDTSLNQILRTFELRPPMPQDLSSHPLFNQSGFEPELCFGDILCAFVWEGNSSLEPYKNISKTKIRCDKNDDSGMSDNISIKSDSLSVSAPRLHNFVRTHFQRATQCDFCGKKIWLKDAVQCRDCSMSCHKKCVNKCQNSTVCGPVDLTTPTLALTPEFTVTEPHTTLDTSEGEEVLASGTEEEQSNMSNSNSLDVGHGSLAGLLTQGIKRVNSANNLAIPGIVSTLTGVSCGASSQPKSLPPTPQHSMSRKSSLASGSVNPFEISIKLLEELPSDISTLQVQQVNSIAEPIIQASVDVDTMSLAKNLSKNLYSNLSSIERVDNINILLAKLRLIMDFEAKINTVPKSVGSTTNESMSERSVSIELEDKMQALSVIMLYLCSGLQAAQGLAAQ